MHPQIAGQITIAPSPVKLSREQSRNLLVKAWAARTDEETARDTLRQVAAGLLVESHFDVAIARARLGEDAESILESYRDEHRSRARAADSMFRRVAGSYGMGRRR